MYSTNAKSLIQAVASWAAVWRVTNLRFSLWRGQTSTAPFVKAGQVGAMSSPEATERGTLSPWEVGAEDLLVGVWRVFIAKTHLQSMVGNPLHQSPTRYMTSTLLVSCPQQPMCPQQSP